MENTELLTRLPAFQGSRVVVTSKQSVGRIMKEVVKAHNDYAADYDKIAEYFFADSQLATERKLFDFCKENLHYNIESDETQTVRSPAAILVLDEIRGVDCKHYASFIGGVLDAINRTGYENFDWFYRFASYDINDQVPEHVFVVVKENGEEIWIDPVIDDFDGRWPYPYFIKDSKPNKMALLRISGISGKMHIGAPAGYTTTNYAKAGSQYTNGPGKCHRLGCSGGCGMHGAIGKNRIGTTSSTGSVILAVAPKLAVIPVVGWIAAAAGSVIGAALAIFGDSHVQGPDIRWLIQLYQYYALGNANVKSDNQVNEGLMQQAWAFFSVVTGVPVYSRSAWNTLHDGHEEGKYTGLDAAGRAAVYVRITGNPGQMPLSEIISAAAIAQTFQYTAGPGGWAYATAAPSTISQKADGTFTNNTSIPVPATTAAGQLISTAPGAGIMGWFQQNPALGAAGIAIGIFALVKLIK